MVLRPFLLFTTAINLLLMVPLQPVLAQADAPAIDNDDIGGVVTRRERTGSRRLGDRGDHRPADPLHQERRHRRPGPLRHPRPADRELSGLGARLRPGRLAEDARQARPDAQSHRGGGAERRPRPRTTIRRSTGTR